MMRSNVEIGKEILEVSRGEAKKTRVVYKANPDLVLVGTYYARCGHLLVQLGIKKWTDLCLKKLFLNFVIDNCCCYIYIVAMECYNQTRGNGGEVSEEPL